MGTQQGEKNLTGTQEEEEKTCNDQRWSGKGLWGAGGSGKRPAANPGV